MTGQPYNDDPLGLGVKGRARENRLSQSLQGLLPIGGPLPDPNWEGFWQSMDTYRDYLESSWHEEFDNWRANFVSPWADLEETETLGYRRNFDSALRQGAGLGGDEVEDEARDRDVEFGVGERQGLGVGHSESRARIGHAAEEEAHAALAVLDGEEEGAIHAHHDWFWRTATTFTHYHCRCGGGLGAFLVEGEKGFVKNRRDEGPILFPPGFPLGMAAISTWPW